MTKLIAEIGCNHKGDMKIAKEMISIAGTFIKTDIVKFQKRNNRELLSEEEYNSPHPNHSNSYGSTYGEHREFLELDIDQHKQLKKWCNEFGVEYSTSVWDITSAREIIGINPSLIKIPSAVNQNKPLLMELINNFKGEIHVSLGMTKPEDVEKIVLLFEEHKRNNDMVIYACTSGYPVSFEDICLFEISKLKEKYASRVKGIGFSGQHLGIAADIAALTLGVSYIERHYTLDRTWKGTDHSASLEADGLRKLCRDIKNVSKAFQYKKSPLLKVEEETFKKLKARNVCWE